MKKTGALCTLCLSLLIPISCENYDDLKPVLRNHASVLEKTVRGIHNSQNSSQTAASLRFLNGAMNDTLNEYRAARVKHPGLKNLFKNPPASLRKEVVEIGELNASLRASLLLKIDHSSDTYLRQCLAETISLLDAITRE